MFSRLPTLENLTKHCWKQRFLVCPGFNAGFFCGLQVRGRERYKMLQKISDGLHMLDDVRPPEQRPNR